MKELLYFVYYRVILFYMIKDSFKNRVMSCIYELIQPPNPYSLLWPRADTGTLIITDTKKLSCSTWWWSLLSKPLCNITEYISYFIVSMLNDRIKNTDPKANGIWGKTTWMRSLYVIYNYWSAINKVTQWSEHQIFLTFCTFRMCPSTFLHDDSNQGSRFHKDR